MKQDEDLKEIEKQALEKLVKDITFLIILLLVIPAGLKVLSLGF